MEITYIKLIYGENVEGVDLHLKHYLIHIYKNKQTCDLCSGVLCRFSAVMMPLQSAAPDARITALSSCNLGEQNTKH